MSIAVSNCCIAGKEWQKRGPSRGISLRSLKRRISISNIISKWKRKRPAWTKNEICVAVSRGTRSRERAPLRNLWRHSPKFRHRYSCRFADGKYARRDHVCGFARVLCVCVCIYIWVCVHPSFLVAPCTSNFNSLIYFPFSYILTFFSCLFLYFFTYFFYVDVALSVFSCEWSKIMAEERTITRI